MRKFEKVSMDTFKEFLEKKSDALESQWQRDNKAEYFEKKLPIPKRKTAYSAGYDFTCPYDVYIEPGKAVMIPTGIKVMLDPGKKLDLYPRSSLGCKHFGMLANTVGIIDSDYYNNEENEGHILAMIRNTGDKPFHIKQGERFCQGIITSFYTVDGDDIGKGEKRKGGIGSTGNK
jgi:dUTP pyrophosphatase